ncbi:PAAR domain-containing protein [Acinetobacter bereziniae]|uniref:PAAR domain-containing protein n=1 Tax=Acinetobacter bereziniae TaxID=106648 RepID=UPI0021D1DC00|nr:PAAR domain-containing protein [Acinetobacter bereziniae]MCU4437132.1 PAAR domain-containing protein [Acinetobacter bereziniae]
MTSPKFLYELPFEQLQQMSQEDIQQTLKAEQLYFKHRPKATYYIAVNGSKTKNGGLVKASALQCKIGGLAVALVGDEVLYADGTISKIVSGTGKASLIEGKSIALVGSHLENGDEIIDSPNQSVAFHIFKGEKAPEGFLNLEEGIQHG